MSPNIDKDCTMVFKEEFNLSEKTFDWGDGKQHPCEVISIKDAKEFIRLLKENIIVPKECDAGTALREMVKRIDTLAGEKLK